MPKRTIEIEDVLPDRVAAAIEDVESEVRQYIKDNSPDEPPCLNSDLDRVHEIIDGAVPVYNGEIEAAWFLHGADLEQAYEDAGIGENPRENNGMTAIYCYIEQKVHEWYDSNADRIFDEVTNS